MRLAPGLGSIEVISYGRILCMADGRMDGRRAKGGVESVGSAWAYQYLALWFVVEKEGKHYYLSPGMVNICMHAQIDSEKTVKKTHQIIVANEYGSFFLFFPSNVREESQAERDARR